MCCLPEVPSSLQEAKAGDKEAAKAQHYSPQLQALMEKGWESGEAKVLAKSPSLPYDTLNNAQELPSLSPRRCTQSKHMHLPLSHSFYPIAQ